MSGSQPAQQAAHLRVFQFAAGAARRPLPDGIYRDAGGTVRLVDPTVTFEQLVRASSDKIRLAGRGMPAVFSLSHCASAAEPPRVSIVNTARHLEKRDIDCASFLQDGLVSGYLNISVRL